MSYKVKKMLKAIAKLFIIVLLAAAFIVINHRIDLFRLAEIRDVGDSENYAYQVDAVSKDKSHFFLEGWFFRLEEVRKVIKEYDHDTEFGVLLEKLDPKTGKAMYDDDSVVGEIVEDTDEKATGLKLLFSELTNKGGKKVHGILANTEITTRNDVNDYFACDHDYSNCGFKASFELSDLDLENGLYRVVFKTDLSKKESVTANAYIYKGELSYTNPVQSRSLDVVGTDLEEIVNNGVCLVSRPDYHCDIYQYGWKLYWIVDDGFYFKENGSTTLVYMMGTT